MFFLILKKKRLIKPLLLAAMAFIAGCLFIFIPASASADNFFVVTQLPTQLDKNMSVFSGFVSNSNDDNANVWFEYGKNGKFEESSVKNKVKGTRDFISLAYGFESGVVYSYRAVGRKQNSNVIKYGDTKTFIIDSKDGSYNTSNQSSNSSDSSSQSNNASGSSDFSCEQFCATCCTSVPAGSSVKPTVSSVGTPLTTNTTATLSSTVLTGGASTRGWFEWGTTRSLGRVTPAKKLGSASKVEMKETIYGLSQGTTYYYRSVAVTSAGVSRSAITSFTTQGQKSGGAESDADDSLGGSENIFNQTTKDTTDKNLTDSNNSEDKTSSKKQDSDEDPLGGVFAWGSTLRGQFFTIDEKGNIDTSISFNETKKEKQNFLLASAAYGKRFLPDTWSEWGFITIFLYLIISRLHNFWMVRKKRKKEKKEREEEMNKARDMQLEQTTNGGGVIA